MECSAEAFAPAITSENFMTGLMMMMLEIEVIERKLASKMKTPWIQLHKLDYERENDGQHRF